MNITGYDIVHEYSPMLINIPGYDIVHLYLSVLMNITRYEIVHEYSSFHYTDLWNIDNRSRDDFSSLCDRVRRV